MTMAEYSKQLAEKRMPLLNKAKEILAKNGDKDKAAYQWRILFRNANGNVSITHTIVSGLEPMKLSEAMSFMTDFVVDNYIGARAYSFDYWK